MNKITASIEAFNAATSANNNNANTNAIAPVNATRIPVRKLLISSDKNRNYNRLAALTSRAQAQVRRAAEAMMYTPVCDEWRETITMEEFNTVCAQLAYELYPYAVERVLDYEVHDDEESSAQRVLNRLTLAALRVTLKQGGKGQWEAIVRCCLIADGSALCEVHFAHEWTA